MKLRFRFSAIVVDRLLIGIVLALASAVTMVAWQLPAPHLTFNYKETAIDVRADKAWSLGPGDCFQITWHIEGSQSIHIEGVERRESGQASFCPAVFGPNPKVELTDHGNDVYRSYSPNTFYVPDVVVNVLGLAALGFFPLLALYYLWSNDLTRRPSLRVILLALLAILLVIVLLRLSGRTITIVGVLSIARNFFAQPDWQYFGVLVIATVFALLAIQAMSQIVKRRAWEDIIAVGGFLAFIGLLYLPFGFDTIAHWEEWFSRAFFEGMERSRWITEFAQRYWMMLSHATAYLVDSESFFGLNALFALYLWGKLVLFYSILRHLGVRRLFAFLITMLFGVYPVDSGLMYLRSITLQFSVLSMLTAVYLALRYRQRPTRYYLAGLLAMLLACVGSYEAQYALLLVLPLLWWYRAGEVRWREFNLTVLWYLAPALKLTYLALLALTKRGFYRSHYVYAGTEVRVDNLIPTSIDNLIEVYHRTFILGWRDALADMGRNNWQLLTVAMVALGGSIAWYLWKREQNKGGANEQQLILSFLTGMAMIFPAVGVLIWFGYYSQDLWRLYLYVPAPAAIALFSLIALIASRISSDRIRNAAIVFTCLLLMYPAMSRLILQHEHYVVSANNKRRVLQQIVQMAPELERETRVLVVSTMSEEQRLSKHIEELKSRAIGNALYFIHETETSGLGSLCLAASHCYLVSDWADHLSDTLVFLLHEDLSLELVREPETIFSEFNGLNYDVTRLYNPDAPLPQRAYTMLGLTKP